MQDWRYYREALTAEEIKRLAFESIDEDGKNLRTCERSDEGGDTDWKDVKGKGCGISLSLFLSFSLSLHARSGRGEKLLSPRLSLTHTLLSAFSVS